MALFCDPSVWGRDEEIPLPGKLDTTAEQSSVLRPTNPSFQTPSNAFTQRDKSVALR